MFDFSFSSGRQALVSLVGALLFGGVMLSAAVLPAQVAVASAIHL